MLQTQTQGASIPAAVICSPGPRGLLLLPPVLPHGALAVALAQPCAHLHSCWVRDPAGCCTIPTGQLVNQHSCCSDGCACRLCQRTTRAPSLTPLATAATLNFATGLACQPITGTVLFVRPVCLSHACASPLLCYCHSSICLVRASFRCIVQSALLLSAAEARSGTSSHDTASSFIKP